MWAVSLPLLQLSVKSLTCLQPFLNHKHCSWSSFFIHCKGSYCILQQTAVASLCCSTVRQILAHRGWKAPLLRQPQRSLWDETGLSYITCTFRCCSWRSKEITGTPALTTTYHMAWHIAYILHWKCKILVNTVSDFQATTTSTTRKAQPLTPNLGEEQGQLPEVSLSICNIPDCKQT